MNIEALTVFLSPGAPDPAVRSLPQVDLGFTQPWVLPPRTGSVAPAELARHLRAKARVRTSFSRDRRGSLIRLKPPRSAEFTVPVSKARDAVLGGWLVLPPVDAGEETVLDVVMDQAFGSRSVHTSEPKITANGSILVVGSRVLVRVGLAGGLSDPTGQFANLRRCNALGLSVVPEALSEGRVGRFAWTTESLLPGSRPGRMSRTITEDALVFCHEMPSLDQPIANVFASLFETVPTHRAVLEELAEAVNSSLVGFPSVFTHGDMWRGNLLAESRLTGVVDWDAATDSGVPGVDVLHVLGDSMGRRRGKSFGEIAAIEAWEAPSVRRHLDAYLRRRSIEPAARLRTAVGLSWWATVTSNSLGRNPGLVNSREWMDRNVNILVERFPHMKFSTP